MKAKNTITKEQYDALLYASMSERDFQAQVVHYAKTHGWLCYHTHDSRHSEPGFPDLVLIRPPFVLIRELKTMRGRVTKAQQRWLTMFEQCGLDVDVWRPGDMRAIVEQLSILPDRFDLATAIGLAKAEARTRAGEIR